MLSYTSTIKISICLLGVFVVQSCGHLGSCEDHTPRCADWARRGLCRQNELFMAHNCPVSCDLCIDPQCRDQDRRCSAFAQQGQCAVIPNMLQICPHSCNNCNIPVFKTIINPDFQCGGPGNAQRNRRQVLFPDEVGQRKQTKPPVVKKEKPMMKVVGNMNGNINVNDTFCGATPISDRFLLTAAHCVFSSTHTPLTVRLGELDFGSANEANSQPVDYDIEEIIVHPEYERDSFSRYNDIALIKTIQTIEFTDLIFPFCISADRPRHGSEVIGAGFGKVNSTTRVTHLQEVVLNIVGPAECEGIYERESNLQQLRLSYPNLLQGRGILCAAFPGRDACEGDSGGPLFTEDSQGRRFLVGIVSAGIPCGDDGVSLLPGTYVSVADQIDFIDSVLYP